MLSIIADMLLTATRQDENRWPERDLHHADRFTSDPHRREAERRRRHNPYSYFQ